MKTEQEIKDRLVELNKEEKILFKEFMDVTTKDKAEVSRKMLRVSNKIFTLEWVLDEDD